MKPKESVKKTPGSCFRIRGPRKKALTKRWSNKKKKTVRQLFAVPEFCHLPTRETLTYAEAQNLVDIDVGGELHRLNICDRLEIMPDDDAEFKASRECSLPTGNAFGVAASTPPQSVTESLPKPVCRRVREPVETKNEMKRKAAYYRSKEQLDEEYSEDIDYDMDEQDIEWLKLVNVARRRERLIALSADDLEYVIDRLEKQSFQLSVAAAAASDSRHDDQVACAVCGEVDEQPSNKLVLCDSCELRVHQDCYGVPYRPEGQWLCRLCLRAPGTDVVCCLCPNSGDGAYKQTIDGRWVHVLCALCVPEVTFTNALHLEPIVIPERLPASRCSVTCCGCRRRSVGACVQCQATGCRLACHATCVADAGFLLRLEKAPINGSRMNIRKIVFCQMHRPPSEMSTTIQCGDGLLSNGIVKMAGTSDKSSDGVESVGKDAADCSKQKSAKAEIGQVTQPSFPVSTVSQAWLTKISEELGVRDKKRAIGLMYSYWLLRRLERRGLPLLQNLYLAMNRVFKMNSCPSNGIGKTGLSLLKKIRQNMEKVRLLLELIRKREKLKAEWIKYHEVKMSLTLRPMAVFFHRILDQLQAKDPDEIFATPVPIDEVPDYLDKVKHPMDFSTMREKVDLHSYQSMDNFDADFQLIITNCLTYNEIDSPLYDVALKLRKQGSAIISAARRLYDQADYCSNTGLHSGTTVPAPRRASGPTTNESSGLTTRQCSEVKPDIGLCNGKIPTPNGAQSLEAELVALEKQMTISQNIKKQANNYLVRQLKKQITSCKRKLTLERLRTVDEIKEEIFESITCASQAALRRSPLHSSESYAQPSKQEIGVNVDEYQRQTSNGICVAVDAPSESDGPHVTGKHDSRSRIACLGNVAASLLRRVSPRCQISLLGSDEISEKLKDIESIDCADYGLAFGRVNGIKLDPASSSVQQKMNCRLAGGQCRVAPAMLSRAGQYSSQSSKRPANAELLPVLKRLCMKGSCDAEDDGNARIASRYRAASRLVARPASVENESSIESSLSGISDIDCSLSALSFEKVVKRPSIHCSLESSVDADQQLCHTFLPGDVVWAKTRGYPWYPAVIVSPNNNRSRTTFRPPDDVLALRYKYPGIVYLIRFFDKRRMWQWLPRDNLEPLGSDRSFDSAKIAEIKSSKRGDIRRAFYEAVRCSRQSSGIVRGSDRVNSKLLVSK